jgi:hypothetical protein
MTSAEQAQAGAQDESAPERVRGKPFTSESAREAASRSAETRRQARTGAGLSDQDIERALRRKAAKGDVAAARELRERAVRLPSVTGSDVSGHIDLESMSDEALKRLRARLLSMAVRMEARAEAARAARPVAAPPRSSESRP